VHLPNTVRLCPALAHDAFSMCPSFSASRASTFLWCFKCPVHCISCANCLSTILQLNSVVLESTTTTKIATVATSWTQRTRARVSVSVGTEVESFSSAMGLRFLPIQMIPRCSTTPMRTKTSRVKSLRALPPLNPRRMTCPRPRRMPPRRSNRASQSLRTRPRRRRQKRPLSKVRRTRWSFHARTHRLRRIVLALAGSNFGRERVAGVEAVEETVDLSTDFAWYACVTHIHPRVVRPGVQIGSEEMISFPPDAYVRKSTHDMGASICNEAAKLPAPISPLSFASTPPARSQFLLSLPLHLFYFCHCFSRLGRRVAVRFFFYMSLREERKE
jgi:hypothetical protein